MTHKTIGILAIALIVVTIIIVTTQNKTFETSEHEKIKIGIITMTTGNLAFLGENIVNSAELARTQLGRDSDVEFIVEDVGDIDAQGVRASKAVQKLINTDHVKYIIDGMTSNGTLSVAPIVNSAHVVMVTPLTGGENIDASGEYIFRNGPSDILAGQIPARDFAEKFNYKKIALITDKAEYTLDIAKQFKNTFTGTIVSDEEIQPDGKDYRTVISKVKAAQPDAIFINTATGVSARYIIKQARELGITAPIFANFLAFGPDLLEVAGDSAEGIYIYDPEYNKGSEKVSKLMQEYTERFGYESPIAFHTTGTYDAVRMGLEAIDDVGQSGPAIHDYLLKNIQNWNGYSGIVSFDKNGNSGTGFVLKQIKNGKLELVN